MALGARSFDVFLQVVGRGLLLALLGTAFGLAGSLAATRVLAGFLFSVRSTDPLTFAAVALLLICVAFVASYVPARRAAKVDPMVALRYE
jgi:putative ABC transport system permease protein